MILSLFICCASSFNIKETILGEWNVLDELNRAAFTFEFHQKDNIIIGSLWSNELVSEDQYDPDIFLMCSFSIYFSSQNEGKIMRSCPVSAGSESMFNFSDKNGVISSVVHFGQNDDYFISLDNHSFGTITFNDTSLAFSRSKLYSIPLWKQYFSYLVFGGFLLILFQIVSLIRMNVRESKLLADRKKAQTKENFEKHSAEKSKQMDKKPNDKEKNSENIEEGTNEDVNNQHRKID